MPVIPQYNAQRNITAQTSGPMRDEASKPFEDQQKVMGTLRDITQKWSDAQDVIQYTDAKGKFELGIADIKGRATADPDYQNSDTYLKDITKLASTSLSGIKNKVVTSKVSLEFGYGSQIAALDIESIFQKKEIAHGQVMLDTGLDALANKRVVSENPAQIDQEIQNLIGYNVKSGIISEEEGAKKLDDTKKTIVKYDIYSDPATEEKDSEVLKSLKDSNGKYTYLSAKDRLSMIEESQRRIFQNNQSYKRDVEVSQSARNDAFIDKLASGTANFKDIDAEFAIPESSGGMKRNVLDQYQRRLQSGVKNDLDVMLREKDANKDPTERAKKVKEYNDLIDMFIDDAGDQWKAKEALAKGYADGNLDAAEMKILNPIKSNLRDIEFNRNTSPVASAIKEVKKWMKASNASDEDIAFRTKQLINSIGGGDRPQEAMKKTMDSEMLKHFPDYTTYPKEGKEKIDRTTGRRYKVFPDGSWAWSTPKKTESK